MISAVLRLPFAHCGLGREKSLPRSLHSGRRSLSKPLCEIPDLDNGRAEPSRQPSHQQPRPSLSRRPSLEADRRENRRPPQARCLDSGLGSVQTREPSAARRPESYNLPRNVPVSAPVMFAPPQPEAESRRARATVRTAPPTTMRQPSKTSTRTGGGGGGARDLAWPMKYGLEKFRPYKVVFTPPGRVSFAGGVPQPLTVRVPGATAAAGHRGVQRGEAGVRHLLRVRRRLALAVDGRLRARGAGRGAAAQGGRASAPGPGAEEGEQVSAA